jgi:putative NADPH-quinone reductase
MNKVTIIFAHPFFGQSVANKTIISTLQKEKEEYEIRNLIELYPDFNIDVKKEQEVLLQSDVIVLQFPFFWYNVPAIMKQWLDMVFEHGFAFGSTGDKLKGKKFIVSFTIGGVKDSYSPIGYNHFRIEDFLHMFEQAAYLSQMQYMDPIYEYGMRTFGDGVDIEAVKQKAVRQAKRIIEAIDGIK